MVRDYWHAVLMRAWHAVWETAAATLPATFVITPAMVEHFDWRVIYVVLAWALTALIAGIFSIIKSLAAGIPEAEQIDVLDYVEEEEGDDVDEGE